MTKFELNGKKYDVVPMTFNTVCELEERGVSLDEFSKKKLSITRAYVSIASGLELEEASNEIEQHIKNGNTLKEIFEIIGDEIEKSDFFQTLNQKAEPEAQEVEEQA